MLPCLSLSAAPFKDYLPIQWFGSVEERSDDGLEHGFLDRGVHAPDVVHDSVEERHVQVRALQAPSVLLGVDLNTVISQEIQITSVWGGLKMKLLGYPTEPDITPDVRPARFLVYINCMSQIFNLTKR